MTWRLPGSEQPEMTDCLGVLGEYRLLRQIGGGGMGLVFAAEDTMLRREIALKVIRPEHSVNPESTERFLREARAVAAIQHEHIIPVYRVGIEHGTAYIAMPLLQGQPLEAWVAPDIRLTVPQILRIGREIAVGLAAAHSCGLIHRDIKPGNIWIEAPHGKVMLLDFGLARPLDQITHLTMPGMVVGTPRYMSPEQSRGLALDARSDLFSLGVVLYVLATQEYPFDSTTTLGLAMALATLTPAPVRNFNPDLPVALDQLIAQLLEKDPAKRPHTAMTVVHAIEAIEREHPGADGSMMVTRSHWSDRSTSGSGGSGPHASTPHLRDSRTPGMGVFTQPAVSAPWSLPSGAHAAAPTPSRWKYGVGAGLILSLVGAALVGSGGFSKKDSPDGGVVPVPAQTVAPAHSAPDAKHPIKVGILHSLTGTMAISEKSVVNATEFAIDELNDNGGVLGRKVVPLVEDGRSDWPTFAQKAEKLIRRDKVNFIFGCWTSASRKFVKPIVERYDSLLFYPVQYEGLEESPNIIYTGATPNQQILPAVKWAYAFLNKKRAFLIGSDYIFPRMANEIIHDEVKTLGGTVVGEAYIPLGAADGFDGVVAKIKASGAEVVFNTINGDSNIAFFRALRRGNVKAAEVPTISFSISEEELANLSIPDIVGEYAAWNYFQNLDRPKNLEFLKAFRARYGADRVVSDPMEAAYFGVHLWAKAVEKAGTDDERAVRLALKGMTYDAPGCLVRIDPDTLHTAKIARIGKINDQGHFQVIYSSDTRLDPIPYPHTHPRPEWDAKLERLFKQWGNHWANPVDDNIPTTTR